MSGEILNHRDTSAAETLTAPLASEYVRALDARVNSLASQIERKRRKVALARAEEELRLVGHPPTLVEKLNLAKLRAAATAPETDKGFIVAPPTPEQLEVENVFRMARVTRSELLAQNAKSDALSS
jgi:hypothetical protein